MMLPAKDPAEIINIIFDFTDEIGSAAIAGVPVVTVAIANGVDPDVAQLPNGAPTVLGALTYQSVKVGVHLVDYYWRCLATLSDGRKLVRAATLPVRNAG